MNKATIYENKAEGEPLKLKPKSEYSSDYRQRKNIRMIAYCRVSTDKKEQGAALRRSRNIIGNIYQIKRTVFTSGFTRMKHPARIRKSAKISYV